MGSARKAYGDGILTSSLPTSTGGRRSLGITVFKCFERFISADFGHYVHQAISLHNDTSAEIWLIIGAVFQCMECEMVTNFGYKLHPSWRVDDLLTTGEILHWDVTACDWLGNSFTVKPLAVSWHYLL